ncbi:MAG: DUF4845 domain-containing protein [Deltaproteobacteria bacterium]|nr:DUF4845 domain-containing protein [Deltaproteobacteria bacterium]
MGEYKGMRQSEKVFPHIGGQTGSSKIFTLIWVLLLAGVVYVVMKIAPVYIINYQIQNLFEVNANRIQTTPIGDIKSDISAKLRQIHAPIALNDVVVDQDGSGSVTISARYSVIVKFIDDYKITFHFSPEARTNG